MSQVNAAVRIGILVIGIVFATAGLVYSDGPVRGLVVDRGDGMVWIGLAEPVPRDAVFEVRLVPGDTVIARARVLECTQDSPFVAKARLKLVDPKGFIPIGAYAEVTDHLIPEQDRPNGYKDVKLGPSGINPLSGSVFAFFPTNSALEAQTNSVWPWFEVDYRMCDNDHLSTNLGVAFTKKQGNFTLGGLPANRDFQVLPVIYDVRLWVQPSPPSGRWFGRLGVGAYTVRDRLNVNGAITVNTQVTFGWLAGFGYESHNGQSAQVYYTNTSETGFRGIAAGVGVRF